MSGLEHWLPSHDSLSGTYLLLLWAAGAVAVLVVVLGALAFRDDGMRGTLTVLLRGAAVLVFAALAWGWLDFTLTRERAAERRALDARASELAARALAPGSALACLGGTANEVIDAACVQAVFASPQAVAAAVAYTEAKLKLLADSLEYARRDRRYAGEIERLRQGLEADRFGLVAHVLAGRGCNAEKCGAFALLRDASKVRANLTDRFFDAHIASHSANWRSDNAGAAAAPAVAPATTSALPNAGGTAGSKYNFPSAATIPPVSIMNAEPTGSTPPANASNAASPPPPGPMPESQTPPARRQSSSRPAQGQRLPPPPTALSGPAPNPR
jgi:hypothetical protein